MVWNCTHSGYKWKHYMLVSERYIWADGRVVINNNGPDMINSAGIHAIHFLWWGYVYKFEISCKKSPNFYVSLLANYGILRKISYLCPRIEAFFAYCKIQKRAEVRSFPYCYLYNIGKRPTSWFSIKVQFRASYHISLLVYFV